MNKNFFRFQLPWLLLMTLIFIQSSIGSLKIPDIEFDLADKLIHFILYGCLGILTARGLNNAQNKKIKENYVLLSIFICVLYGASDEIHQYFVPGRYASWGDWIADALGVITFVFIYKWYFNYQAQKRKN
jgi:VanZ family protein